MLAAVGLVVPAVYVAVVACLALERRWPAVVVGMSAVAATVAVAVVDPRLALIEIGPFAIALAVLAAGSLGWRRPTTRTLVVDATWSLALVLLAPISLARAEALLGSPSQLVPDVDGPLVATLGVGLVGFLAFDLANYASHLARHRLPVLWRFHELHHSATALGPLTARRRHPVDALVARVVGFVPLLVVAPLAWSAFVPWLVARSAAGYYHHSGASFSFGPLSGVVTTPAVHRLHHSTRPDHAAGCNFGAVLVIWDRMFGTYAAPVPDEELEVGLVESRVADENDAAAGLLSVLGAQLLGPFRATAGR